MKRFVNYTIIVLSGYFLFTVFISSCENELDVTPFYEGIYEGRNQTIMEFIVANEDSFSMFEELLEEGELNLTLTAYNPHGNDYTLFLPTNEAIEFFIENDDRFNSFEELLVDSSYVKNLVRYHVISRGLQKNDFPYGALSDTTLSGDYLTIGFTGSADAPVLRVNNEASIIQNDIELTNGYVHIINRLLKPVVENSFQWLSKTSNYSIFTQALIETGIKDTFEYEENGKLKFPPNSLLVESDEVYAQKGIFSIDDLKERYSPESQDYRNYNNGLFQFVAYHILEGKTYLNNLEGKNTNYNTYASLPIWIDGTGLEIKINRGVEVFDSIISQNDTTIIDYVSLEYDLSNIPTINGAVHILENVMELFRPKAKQRIFEFLEEPLIAEANLNTGTYTFDSEDLEEFEVIKWQGIEEIEYVFSSSNLQGVWNNDYLEMEGDFIITYEIPKILPGNYKVYLKANEEYYNNATIQIFLDGKSMGENIDLTANPSINSSFNNYEIGQVVFDNYDKHLIRVQTLIPGRFTWDGVMFQPVN